MASLLRSSSSSLLRRHTILTRYLSTTTTATTTSVPTPIDQRKLPANYDASTFDPSVPFTPPSDRVFRLVEEISSLTLTEVCELSGMVMSGLGVSEMPNVAVVNGGGGGAGIGGEKEGGKKEVEEKKEKTVFELKLDSFEAASKIKVIKEVRSFTDLGLKEAKELVEKAPSVIKSGVTKEEAQQIIEKMKGVGAKVIME